MPDTLREYPEASIPKIMERAKVIMTPRKPLTRAQIIVLCKRQTDKTGIIRCGCGCGEELAEVCIDEHLVPRETLASELADHIDNRALFNPLCAKRKTVGDQAVIAKGRRQRREKGQQARREASSTRSIKGASSFQKRVGVSALSKHSPGYRKPKWQTRKA